MVYHYRGVNHHVLTGCSTGRVQEYDVSEVETATIASVSSDKKVLTLARPLAYTHLATTDKVRQRQPSYQRGSPHSAGSDVPSFHPWLAQPLSQSAV